MRSTVFLTPLALAAAAHAQSFTPIGDLPGGTFSSTATAISADGRVVTGLSNSGLGSQDGGCCEAYLWTAPGGISPLGDLPKGPYESKGYALSADGAVIVGQGHIGVSMAFRWTADLGLVQLPELPGGGLGGAIALAVSADGSIIVGWDASANGVEAYRCEFGSLPTALGDLPGGTFRSEANGISADGSVIAGLSIGDAGTEAVRWVDGIDPYPLGDLAGGSFKSEAYAISADGAVIVGRSTGASGPEAFRWTESAGMTGLGDLAGGTYYSEALAASADGSVIVGASMTGIGLEAFIWDDAGGMRSLKTELESRGLDLSGWTLTRARGISADGRVIVGYGTNPSGDTEAWIAALGAGCFADCDTSGELDIDDFICFQTLFGLGDPGADCDDSGELDIDDFICFQTAFGVGCK